MKLYEFLPTRSMRARWTLQELDVEFEAVTVNLLKGEHKRPEFLTLNPAGRVPLLVDGDTAITESVAIAVYLAEKYPGKGLMPADPRERAQVMRWLLFTVTEIEQPVWRITKHLNLLPEEKRLSGEVDLARADFAEMAGVLDRYMTDREFVVGDEFTVADIVLGYTLDWAQARDLLGDFPRLEGYMLRMYDRPHAPMRIKDAWAQVRG